MATKNQTTVVNTTIGGALAGLFVVFSPKVGLIFTVEQIAILLPALMMAFNYFIPAGKLEGWFSKKNKM